MTFTFLSSYFKPFTAPLIFPQFSYIKSAENVEADFESRRAVVRNDWCLHDSVYKTISESFFIPTIDLFATDVSAKCSNFISFLPSPGCYEVDSFTIDWSNLRFYAFPQFNLISRVLRKVENDKATGILVVPYWPSQPWFPKFRSLCHSQILTFGPDVNLLKCPYTRRSHPLCQSLKLLIAVVSYHS